MEWRHKNHLGIKMQPEMSESQSSSKSDQSKEIQLVLKARDEGVTKANEPYLHLFYYQFDRPTDKQVHEQILKIRQLVVEKV